jgi:hypothetical protein
MDGRLQTADRAWKPLNANDHDLFEVATKVNIDDEKKVYFGNPLGWTVADLGTLPL